MNKSIETIVSVLYYTILIPIIAVSFVLVLLVWAVTVLFDRNRVVLHGFSRLWARAIFALNPLWSVRVEGIENIDRNRAYVIAVNHQSMLDIPFLYHIPYLQFKWVSKREVYKIPLFGVVLLLHGDIAIERGKPSAWKTLIKKGKDYLDRGVSIMIFPAGTRGRDLQTGKYKEGAFNLAIQAGVPVLPVASVGTGHCMKGWQFRKTSFVISIMPPVETCADDDAKQMAERIELLTQQRLDQLNGK